MKVGIVGWRGMVGGQSLDLEGERHTRSGEPVSLAQLQVIHRLKTGALLRAAENLTHPGVRRGAVARGQVQTILVRVAGLRQ